MNRYLRTIILILSLLTIIGLGLCWGFRFEIHYYRNRALLDAAAARYQVPPALVASLIWQETRFNPTCRGKAGEIGLMQIMPQSAAEWAKAEHIAGFDPHSLFDPGTNMLAGTWYLARALTRWSAQTDPVPYALAEYNAGRSNVIRWERNTAQRPGMFTESISYPGTRSYVRNILLNYRTFGKPWERW